MSGYANLYESIVLWELRTMKDIILSTSERFLQLLKLKNRKSKSSKLHVSEDSLS